VRKAAVRYTALGVIAIAIVFSAWLATADKAHATGTTITVTAGNWWFKPDTITVQVGQPVTITLKSEQGVHGIKSDELGIPNTVLLPGKEVTVTFTAKAAGTYKVFCSVPCGPGHDKQFFTVVAK